MVGGMPQGSPLSPALFTIYMSPVVKRVEELIPPWGTRGVEAPTRVPSTPSLS